MPIIRPEKPLASSAVAELRPLPVGEQRGSAAGPGARNYREVTHGRRTGEGGRAGGGGLARRHRRRHGQGRDGVLLRRGGGRGPARGEPRGPAPSPERGGRK